MNQTMIDILLAVLTACAPVLAAIASGALWTLWTKYGLQGVAIDKVNMEAEIHAALQFGIGTVLPLIASKGWDSEDVRRLILTAATDYFTKRFPDRTATIAAAAKVEGTIPVAVATRDTLSARLQDAITTAAASPGTPPVAAPA